MAEHQEITVVRVRCPRPNCGFFASARTEERAVLYHRHHLAWHQLGPHYQQHVWDGGTITESIGPPSRRMVEGDDA